jgi:hypothetical protein
VALLLLSLTNPPERRRGRRLLARQSVSVF